MSSQFYSEWRASSFAYPADSQATHSACQLWLANRRVPVVERRLGLLSLLRNEGGSVGTSLAQTLHERRDQFHTLRLGEYLDLFNPAVRSFVEQA
jgi:hypothetical protein